MDIPALSMAMAQYNINSQVGVATVSYTHLTLPTN